MNPYEQNKEIESLVESKDTFTQEEINFISQYTGMGGLEKYGAEGRGLLHEYYTPIRLIEKMWGLVAKYSFVGGKVLEPSSGIGRFMQFTDAPTKAYETNPLTAKICKILNPNAEVINDSFTSHFYSKDKYDKNEFENDFDLVIGNPPYGEFNDKNSYSEKKKINVPNMRFDHYFIIRGLDCLKSGGLLCFVVTDSLFKDSSNKKVISLIETKSELLDAYLLPDSTFPTTKQPTSLIVLKKL